MLEIQGFAPPYMVHLGCNTTKMEGWVNIDARKTEATDLVHNCIDLSPFEDCSIRFVYSNAFFEHLRMNDRPKLLVDIHRVLTQEGILFFTGIPDFEIIARSYLEGRAGHVSPRFDLFEVYRYTHGDPEHQSDWWVEQLHKTLFDVTSVKSLLAQAGFRAVHVYRYAYGNEVNPVNLGFMARKSDQPLTKEEIEQLIRGSAGVSGVNLARVELNL